MNYEENVKGVKKNIGNEKTKIRKEHGIGIRSCTWYVWSYGKGEAKTSFDYF